MNDTAPLIIRISYEPDQIRGLFFLDAPTDSAVWDRVRTAASAATEDSWFSATQAAVPWPAALTLVRELAPQQRRWNFEFKPDASAKLRIDEFVLQYKAVRQARSTPPAIVSVDEIGRRLHAIGFTKRELRECRTGRAGGGPPRGSPDRTAR